MVWNVTNSFSRYWFSAPQSWCQFAKPGPPRSSIMFLPSLAS
jgi:hypothetical protein